MIHALDSQEKWVLSDYLKIRQSPKPPFPQRARHSRESGNPVVQTVYLAVEIKGMTVLR